jgi:hypothetical protein
MLAAENRDLVVRLTATHRKLKLLRSRSQQREALQDARVSACLYWGTLACPSVLLCWLQAFPVKVLLACLQITQHRVTCADENLCSVWLPVAALPAQEASGIAVQGQQLHSVPSGQP